MPGIKRTITDVLGYQVELEVRGEHVTLTTSHPERAVAFTRSNAEIFKAFIERAIQLPSREDAQEHLPTDIVLRLTTGDAPFIRCSTSDASIDIHPASWLPLSCELGLLLPRMRNAA